MAHNVTRIPVAGALKQRYRWTNTDQDWQPRVHELADALGFAHKSVWYWFKQIALSVFHETGWPQSCAEETAWLCINAVFDKRGQEPS